MTEILFNGNAHENAFYSLMKDLNISPGYISSQSQRTAETISLTAMFRREDA